MQQQGRARGERAREGDALLLAAGQLVRIARRLAPEPDEVEHLVDPRAALGNVPSWRSPKPTLSSTRR